MAGLLSNDDKKVCKEISNGEESIHKQRAIALLWIEEGSTQANAAEKSKLSIGQVRYFLKRYKSVGINCFPSEFLNQTDETEEEAIVEVVNTIIEEERKEEKIKEKKPNKKKKKSSKKKDKKEEKKKSEKKKSKEKDSKKKKSKDKKEKKKSSKKKSKKKKKK